MPQSVRGLTLVALLFGICDCARAADDFRQISGGVPAQAGPLYLTLDVSMSGARAAVTPQLLAALGTGRGGLSRPQSDAPSDLPEWHHVKLRLAQAIAMPQQSKDTVLPDPSVAYPVIGLLHAYEEALQNDPAYRAALSEGLAGQESQVLGRSNLLPTVTSSAAASKNRSEVTTDVPGVGTSVVTSQKNDYPSTSFSIQFRQPLFNLDGLARYRQGIAQSSGSAALLTARGQELILRVVSLYVAANYEEYQLAAAVAQRDADVEMSKLSQRRFASGEGTRPEMIESQVKASLAEAQLLQARDRLEVSRDALAQVVGKKIGGLVGLSGEFPVRPIMPAGFDELRTMVIENNSEITAQRHAVEVSLEEINKSRAGHAPRLDATASVSKGLSETITTLNQKVDTQSIGLQLTIPLYSGGSVSALSRQAIANHEKAKADLDAKINQILIDLRKQYSLVISSAPLLSALDDAVVSAQLQIDAMRAGVRAGANTPVDMLNALRQMSTTQRDLALARFSYLVAYLRLRQAAGTLSVTDLRDVATYFRYQ
jgi:outer membrane protein, protease secretion system